MNKLKRVRWAIDEYIRRNLTDDVRTSDVDVIKTNLLRIANMTGFDELCDEDVLDDVMLNWTNIEDSDVVKDMKADYKDYTDL